MSAEAELIRGRFHPDLHPVLRISRRTPTCRAYGLPFMEDGEEFVRSCQRLEGHTGRHLDWEWHGPSQKVYVWTDAESVDEDGPAPSGEAAEPTTTDKGK